MSTRIISPGRRNGQRHPLNQRCGAGLTRRAFLKLAALGAAAGAAACTPNVVPVNSLWASPTQPSDTPAPARGLSSAAVARIEMDMLSTLATYNMPGLAIAIVRDGRLAFAKGYGVAERNTGRPVTPQSVFGWGGVAETVVATGIMQLRSRGRVNLDAPVTAYLPYFKLDDSRYKDITLRHLLNGTSGLPACVGEDLECQVPAGGEDTLERQVRRLATWRLTHAPGEKFALGLTASEVLGDVIAKVSGRAFEAYMREKIFAPLGLRHTTFTLSEVDPQLMAAPHVCRTGDTSKPVLADSRAHAPSAGLFSSLDDLTRYALMQLGRGSLDGVEILPADAYAEMWADQAATPWAHLPAGQSEYRNRCLGWYSYLDRGGNRMIFALGERQGFFTYVELAPERGAAVLFAGNRYGDLADYYGDLEPTVSSVMDLVLDNLNASRTPDMYVPRLQGKVAVTPAGE